jgi:multisubunit Na+/H+ antiporter MnhB subunit
MANKPNPKQSPLSLNLRLTAREVTVNKLVASALSLPAALAIGWWLVGYAQGQSDLAYQQNPGIGFGAFNVDLRIFVVGVLVLSGLCAAVNVYVFLSTKMVDGVTKCTKVISHCP